jgi:hypothetical protein
LAQLILKLGDAGVDLGGSIPIAVNINLTERFIAIVEII